MKKTLALVLALVLAVGLLAGCGDSSTPSNTQAPQNTTSGNTQQEQATNLTQGNDESLVSGDAENTDYVREEISMDLQQFNFTPMGHRSHGQATYSIFEMLYQTEGGIGTPMVPVLADANRGGNNSLGIKGMDHEDGSGDYTIYIYDYITDSAGNKLTASDCVFSFETIRDYGQATGWQAIDGWEAKDDTTLVMHCSRELDQKGELENILLRAMMFTEKAYNDSPSAFTTDACGTGPYKVTDYVQDAYMVLEAREDYWQTNKELRARSSEANVKKVTVNAINDNNTKITSLQSGDLDMVANIPTTAVGPFLNNDQFTVYNYRQNGIHYLALNCSEDSIMNNPDMRLAIYYAISNENLANILNASGVTAYYPLKAYGHDLFSDYLTKWDDETTYVTEFSIEKSKEYQEKAGYNGETLYFLNANDTTGIVENLQNMLIQAGFKVELKSYDRNTVTSYVGNSKEWDLYYNNTNSSDYLTSLWSHALAINGGVSEPFVTDQTWFDLLDKALEVSATDEDLDAFWQYSLEHAYLYPLVGGINSMVFPAGQITNVYLNDKNQFVPGAAYYAEG